MDNLIRSLKKDELVFPDGPVLKNKLTEIAEEKSGKLKISDQELYDKIFRLAEEK